MRWRMLLTFVLLTGFAFHVSAQQAEIISGEHDGFSRLVIPIRGNTDWRINHTGNRVVLSLPGAEGGFNTDSVFDLIPRDRLNSLSSGPDKVSLNLGCDCRVATFTIQDRFLVLDIVSPGNRADETFIPRDAPSKETEAYTPERPSAGGTALRPGVASLAENLPPLFPLDLPALARTPLSTGEKDLLAQVQRQLSKELGSAASRGLLDPVRDLPQTGAALDDPARGSEPASEARLPPETDVRQPSNIRITTSMDFPALNRPKTSAVQSLSGYDCPDDETLDIPNWSDGRPFHQQLGDLRETLFGEFDRLDPDAAGRLVRLYLHYGFGAEAKGILALSAGSVDEAALLHDIAQIMERGLAAPASTLPQMLDCDTDVALWAMLSKPELDISHRIDPSAALRALNKLPIHLRRFLAPALSQRLLSHGDSSAAELALRTLERVPEELSPPAKLAQANIAIANGKETEASERLADVIDDNSAESPEALITLVETRLAAGQPLEPETAKLIEAYAKELRTGPLGPALRRAHVLALAKSNQFDAAFDALDDLGGNSREQSAIELRMLLLEELLETASDVVFLEFVFQQAPGDIERLLPRPRLALAARLLDLGFAERAQDIGASLPDRPRNPDRQLLMSRIALALEQPQRAQAALIEISGREADLLRAEAKAMAGQHAEASRLFDRTEATDAARTAAWLAGESGARSLAADPVFGPALGLGGASIPPGPDTDGMLARTSAALEESVNARQTLADLLATPDLAILE